MSHPISEDTIGERIGTFFVPRWLIKDHLTELLKFFAEQEILPLRAECLWHRDGGIEYTAYGVNFEPAPMGRIPYTYVLDTTTEHPQDLEYPFRDAPVILKEIKIRRFN